MHGWIRIAYDGIIKQFFRNKIYVDKPQSTDELKAKILQVISEIRPQFARQFALLLKLVT